MHIKKQVQIGRDARTGRFISVCDARRRRATGVVETVSRTYYARSRRRRRPSAARRRRRPCFKRPSRS